MSDHVTLRASDRRTSEWFYRRVLATLGVAVSYSAEDLVGWGELSLMSAGEGEPVTRGLHLGFAAPSRAHGDVFWEAGIAAGAPDDGPPGPRPEYGQDHYGGFLLDPDGNSAEAVGPRPGGRNNVEVVHHDRP